MNMESEIRTLETDILIIGGGTAGCMAAVAAGEANPDARVLIIEKAHIERSGCLAAGINAINAYLNPGETPGTFLNYVRRDSHGIVREDLVYTMAEGLNAVTERLEGWGLPILKDDNGAYAARGKRSIRINGERFKPILAEAAVKSGAQILNRVAVTDYITAADGTVGGAYCIGVREPVFYIVRAGAVICATGGASGIYRPNNPGNARHKMWYCPFNTGTGYAIGIRAGAELTGLEMRFIALRVKDTAAPTGTLVQGAGATEKNGVGERYLERCRHATTPERLLAVMEEKAAGKGPCRLDLGHLDSSQCSALKEAYLNMAPGMVVWWADRGVEPNEIPLEVEGSEPYVVGGHAGSGYWVDVHRRTTLPGLWAAGDAAGGVPKKYATGCMVEGLIAARDAVSAGRSAPDTDGEQIHRELIRAMRPMTMDCGPSPGEIEEGLQKVMDDYAGGIASEYRLSRPMLEVARNELSRLSAIAEKQKADDLHGLLSAHEVTDRIDVARSLVEHLLFREETRWPVYQSRVDFPVRDDGNWRCYVNSVRGSDGGIRVFKRDYIGWGDSQ